MNISSKESLNKGQNLNKSVYLVLFPYSVLMMSGGTNVFKQTLMIKTYNYFLSLKKYEKQEL